MANEQDPVNAEALQAAWDDGYQAGKEEFAPTTATIAVPYEGYQDLKIDPGSEGYSTLWALQSLIELHNTSRDFDNEVERIMRAAVILFNAQAGPIGECIETAIIWERG